MFFKSKPTEPHAGQSCELAMNAAVELKHELQPGNLSLNAQLEPARPELSLEELRKRRTLSKRMSASLGDIVSILMRSAEFRGLTLAKLQKLAVPAISTGQFLVAEAQSNTTGVAAPIAVALWARVSPEVDRRLSNELEKPITLRPSEWRSGDIPWLIAVAGDRRVLDPIMRKLQGTVLTGQPIKMRIRRADGRIAVSAYGSRD